MALWDDKNLFDRIMDLYNQRKKGYVKFNSARDSITEYFRPDLGSDMTEDGDGSFFGESIYDGVAPWAAETMARGFQGNLVNPSTDWIQYAMEEPELKDNDQLDIWLQEVKDYMSDVYQKSNLYKVLPPFTLDGITIGSPVMFIDEDFSDGSIKFQPHHYKSVILFYDKFNEPNGIIVKDETWTVKQISDRFAQTEEQRARKLSQSTRDAIRDGQLYLEKTVYRVVFKGDNDVWNAKGFEKPDREWISVYFEEKPEEEQKNDPLSTDGYFSRPFVVWDYNKFPWESVSRTPAFNAIYDVLTQNQVAKEGLDNLSLKNRPSMQVLEDHRNIVDFGPEGLTFVAKEDWQFAPKMIDMVGDIKLTKDQLNAGATAIKRWFFTDSFLKFTDLTNTLRQQPSVDQNRRIAAELAVQLSPQIGSYTGELLKSIDDRAVDIESRAGRGPFDPDTLANIEDIIRSNSKDENVASINITPVFIGPLAREQRTQQELDPILTALSVLQPVFEVYPDLKNAIREYGTLEDILKAVNFPLKNLVPEEEYDEIIKQLNAVRAQQQQQTLAIEMAKASPSVSGPVDETSVLAGAGV